MLRKKRKTSGCKLPQTRLREHLAVTGYQSCLLCTRDGLSLPCVDLHTPVIWVIAGFTLDFDVIVFATESFRVSIVAIGISISISTVGATISISTVTTTIVVATTTSASIPAATIS